MLILRRKPGEKIVIGDNIVVLVAEINGSTVQIGVEAPREIPVHRDELLRNHIRQEGTQAQE